MTVNKGTISAFAFNDVILRAIFSCLFLILAFFFPGHCFAQGPQFGLTVQLPTVRNFSVQTTVSVPDGGTISLGGISRSAEGRVSSGIPGLRGRPFRNSATGRETSVGRATASVRIISQRELEEDLLAQGNRQRRMIDAARAALDGRTVDRENDLLGVGESRLVGDIGSEGATDGTFFLVKPSPEIERLADFLAQNVARRR